MLDVVQYILFLVFTIYVFIKTLAYALYEIKIENNKYGGIAIIIFSLFVCLGIDIFVFIK